MEHIPFKYLVCTLLFLGFSFFGFSQKVETEDVIYLKDGSVLKGQIVTYEQGQSLRLHLHTGQELTLPDNDIGRIVQKVKRRVNQRDPLAEGKFYHSFYFSGNLGSNYYKDNDWGLGMEYISGYWLSPQISLGLGGGIIQYSSDYSWRVAPVFIDMKWKSPKKSPVYLGADVGIGFPIKNENVNIIGGEAGERFRIGVGKIWSLRSATNLSTEFAYVHQRARFESNSWNWWSEDYLSQDIRFKRYQLRIGFVF